MHLERHKSASIPQKVVFPTSKEWKWSDNSPVDPQCVSNHRGIWQFAFMQTVERDKIVSSLYELFLNWSLNLVNKFKNLRKTMGC